ncbi:MAG: sigma 54-interacting transcriptional regulator [Hyphomicrobiales bacterium]
MATRVNGDAERRIQSLTEKLLASFEELDFLHSMAAILARPGEVEDLDGYLAREAAAIFHAEGGWVARLSADGTLESSATHGFAPAIGDFLNERLLAPLVREGALPLLVDDLHAALARRGVAQPLPRRVPEADLPRAFLACPLAVNTEVLGVIALGKLEPGDVFTAGDQKLLTTLAVQSALFIKNATLLSRLKAEAKSLGKRVELLESDPRLSPDLSWIRGESPTMRRLAAQVETAAATDATVILLGESGTGKSLVARILHRMSPRRSGPFVEINCGAIPPGLIESELFGHARGAFTGAGRERAGLFEEAKGGTVLLDEVAELPPDMQVKLLSVLEQHRVRRVGENRDRAVDVRVIAATNSDLVSAVRQGRFREDLFYRLNVISLTVPPLRQRREDILPLARRFLAEFARETNRRMEGFTPTAEEALLAHDWPGNVRELRNVIERSLLLKSTGRKIERADLPPLAGGPRSGAMRGGAKAVTLPRGSLSGALREYERDLLQAALEQSDGVVARASGLLGISRTNMHNKLRKHGLLKRAHWSDNSHRK